MSTRTGSKIPAVLLVTAVAVVIAALGLFLTRRVRQPGLPAPPEPFGPIRSIGQVRHDAASLTGQIVRIRGRITDIRDLNPGQPFPWDVVYTVADGSSQIPVHWFTQEKRPKELRPPTLPDRQVIVTGKVKRDLDLDGKTYPVILHELSELHNQARPTMPASPALP
jgi:hypothetical protein